MTSWTEEELAEKRAIALFRKLGYEYKDGRDEIGPDCEAPERKSYQDVFLEDRIKAAIKKFNPWINERNLQEAVKKVTRVSAINAMRANSTIHERLVRHISVKQDLGEGKKGQTVKYIDYDNPENNDFLIVNQLKFAGPEENIIPDLVVYLNGIPVGVIECKNPTIKNPKEKAVDQLRRYQNVRQPQAHEGYEKLFYPNQILVGAWGDSAVHSTIGADHSQFKAWKDPYPLKKAELKEFLGRQEISKQDILLYSMFKKDRLLDLIQNFTVFKEEGGGMVKMMARYQQYRTVQKALERIMGADETDKRGGVVWHTQGSGKSLSMLFLGLKLRRLKNNPVIVIVTDRKDLDNQIAQTFERCGFPNPIQADSIEHLREELKVDVGKTVLTTIHKFQEPEKEEEFQTVLNDSKNVYVMADEAHRTQYKDLASFMRSALPNACYIGFTGTPIEKKYKNTRDTFGRYIDTYTIDESVKDGVTVPIMYEGRLPNVWVEGKTLDQIFDRVFSHKSEKEREMIKSKYANEKAIAQSEERITQICMDIIDHYEEHIKPNGFKGQIVSVSRRAAAIYKEKLEELNGPQSAVIFSGDHNDPPLLKKYHKTDSEQNRIIERFKKPREEDKLSFLIVCDMLLTGFDAPVEQVMYLDKPLKEHNLLQAIARVNRPKPGKNYGLIVDYYGISDNLEKALEMFSKEDVEKAMRPLEEELPRLESRHRKAMSFFDDVDIDDIEECVQVLKPEDVRLKFDVAFRKFSESMDMMLPHPKARPYLDDLKKLGKIRRYARNRYRDEEIDISGSGEKVRELIDNYIRAEGIERLQEGPVSILDDSFEEEVDELKSDEAKASEMEHAIRHEITVRIDENPVVYKSLKERLEEIIEKKKQNRIELTKALEEYGHIVKEIREVQEGSKAEEMGLTDDEYAFYELVKEESEKRFKDLGLDDDKLIEISKEITDTLKELAVIDFRKKRDVQRRMRGNVKKILVNNGWPKEREKLDKTSSVIMDLAEVRLNA